MLQSGVWTPRTVIGTLAITYGSLQLLGGMVMLLFAAMTLKELNGREFMAKMGLILGLSGALIVLAGLGLLT